MDNTLHYEPESTMDALQDQASEEVWDIVRSLEAELPPAQMRLVHKLRLAAEVVGTMRASAPTPVYSSRASYGTRR